jgi:hypothetical protein
MTDTFGPSGLETVPLEAAEATAALESLKEPAERAARSIEQAFDRAGESLAASLTRAAADGEITLAELARAVLAAANSAVGTLMSGGGAGLGEALASAVADPDAGTDADVIPQIRIAPQNRPHSDETLRPDHAACADLRFGADHGERPDRHILGQRGGGINDR